VGQDLRVATKYPKLVQRHLVAHGVNYFSLVQSSGTLEAAPAMGFADIIGDITETGSTIRANRLKQIDGGTAITSEACVISRRMAPELDGAQLATARLLLEMMEAHLGARTFVRVTANMKGETAEEVADYVLRHSDISGLQGPTISRVFTPNGTAWFAVTVIIEENRLISAVDTLREIGGTSVTVDKPSYVFQSESTSYSRLVQAVTDA
jgi:ATP phosphoribosyltransferase